MTIPESQLETWSHQGAVVGSSNAYTSIKDAIDRHNWPDGIKYRIYLQGSYANSTNIRADSDVDVVVQLDSTFHSDIKLLSPEDQARYMGHVSSATYDLTEFRCDILTALRKRYGYLGVTSGPKSLKVAAAPPSSGLAVDVVPCIQYRSYFQFFGGDNDYLEGMTFETNGPLLISSQWIVNYPELHKLLGVNKHSIARTNGWFKPLVRVFKNARNAYNDDIWNFKVTAPSYFIECLLSQIPDRCFGRSFQLSFLSALQWLSPALNSSMASAILCQNRQLPLFGNRPDQWRLDDARSFVDAMWKLWGDWE